MAIGRLCFSQLYYTDQEVKRIIDALKLTPTSRIADFGCGNGRHLLELGRRGYSGVGFDFVASLIEHARTQAETQDIRSIEFKEIACHYVQLGHWDRPLEALDERAKEILFLGEKILIGIWFVHFYDCAS